MIDPIKVQEAQKRDRAELAYASRRVKAADALLWFNEYAPPEKHIDAVLRGGPTLVASSTPNAALALWYISQAAQRALPGILEDAIEMAKRDFDDTPRRAALRQMVKLDRSEEHTSELQSLMRISYAVFCLKKKKTTKPNSKQH